jgi:hypothetical protein
MPPVPVPPIVPMTPGITFPLKVLDELSYVLTLESTCCTFPDESVIMSNSWLINKVLDISMIDSIPTVKMGVNIVELETSVGLNVI